MEIYVREGTQLLATIRDGQVFAAPGVDRERLAFELFRVMNKLLTPEYGAQVTWGSEYSLAANQGGA